MFATPEQIIAAHKANVDAFVNAANCAFAGAERLTALNIDTSRKLFETFVSGTQSALNAKDPQDLSKVQSTLAQPFVDSIVAYNRSVLEISGQSREELTKLVESQLADANSNLNSALDKAVESAPAGSDVAVAAVKSAVAAANSAYDTAYKAAKQMSDMAEANLSSAAESTAKAAGSAAKETSRKSAA